MFTPYSVQRFTPRTELPRGNTSLENPIHHVFKVQDVGSANYRNSAQLDYIKRLGDFRGIVRTAFPFAQRLRRRKEIPPSIAAPIPFATKLRWGGSPSEV